MSDFMRITGLTAEQEVCYREWRELNKPMIEAIKLVKKNVRPTIYDHINTEPGYGDRLLQSFYNQVSHAQQRS